MLTILRAVMREERRAKGIAQRKVDAQQKTINALQRDLAVYRAAGIKSHSPDTPASMTDDSSLEIVRLTTLLEDEHNHNNALRVEIERLNTKLVQATLNVGKAAPEVRSLQTALNSSQADVTIARAEIEEALAKLGESDAQRIKSALTVHQKRNIVEKKDRKIEQLENKNKQLLMLISKHEENTERMRVDLVSMCEDGKEADEHIASLEQEVGLMGNSSGVCPDFD
jgi:chromosome segregation ATPase